MQPKRRRTFCHCFILGTISVLVSVEPVGAAEPSKNIDVQLADGRIVTGAVDSATDEQQLWLRITAPSIVLRSGFPWKDILRVHHANRALSPAEFRLLAPKLKSEFSDASVNLRQTQRSDSQSKNAAGSAAGVPNEQPGQPRRKKPAPRVRSLEIEVVVANWDDDVEADGLRVFVYPLAADGRIVPVEGSIDFRLFGHTVSTAESQGRIPGRLRQPFPELGVWSRRIRAADFNRWGAVYELPFQTIHPEFNLNIDVHGLLNVRLGVPGQGAFDASIATVRLRPVSRFRDQIQLREGQRFLREERVRRKPNKK